MDARALSKVGGEHIKADVKNPSGATTDCIIQDNSDGTYNVEYTPFENGTMHNILLNALLMVCQSDLIYSQLAAFSLQTLDNVCIHALGR